MADDAGGDETSLEFTPTWVVAFVCFCIVFISIAIDRFLRRAGKVLKKYKTWPLIVASRKIKDELMLLGFISLLLAAFQTGIGKICISEQLANVWLPCNKHDSSSTIANLATGSFASTGTRGRRLLTMASDTSDYCSQKGKVPLLSVEAVHHLHIFIFVLATSHVVLCLLKVLSMMGQWRNLGIFDAKFPADDDLQDQELTKIVKFYEKPSFSDIKFPLLLKIALQQRLFSMSMFEYVVLRVNFNMARELKVSGQEFQKHIMGTLSKDFERMIEIRWYLWFFAMIFLLVNVAGWNALFWMSFIPLMLFLIVHSKLELMMRRLAVEVAKRHSAKESVFQFSDQDFLLGRPDLVGKLIHFVLFENSLQLAFFFFILVQYGFHSCIMGKVGFVVPRIVIGAVVQLKCMFRTLPLFAIIKSQKDLKEKQDKIRRINQHLEEHLLNEHIRTPLDYLDAIEAWLTENGMDQKEEMRIVTRISELIDNREDRRKEPNSREESANIEPTRTGSREGSVGHEITRAEDVNSRGDIEEQN